MRDIASPLDGFASPFGPVRRSLRAMLFGANEPGFTFEPWDITTLYQDRAGTTPVTAAGQSVGLRLDKSKGLAIGAELVTNGAFDADTDWIKGAGWTISAGSLNAVSASSQTIQFMTFSAGSVYRVVLVIPEFSAGTLTINLGGDVSYDVTGSGNVSINLRVPSISVGAIFITGTGFTGSIDNISVRELAGNHEVAINDAARGIYGWMPKTGRRNLLVATDTLSTQSVTVTAVAHTLAFTGTGTVTLSGVSTAGPLVGTGAGNRVTLTFTPTAGSLTLTVTGSVTLAQLQIGSVDTAYQAVVSQYDVTEAGVASCYYVQTDGVDDAYVTPTITPGTDKAQFFAGLQKIGTGATAQIIAEMSVTLAANNGAFTVGVPGSVAGAGAFLVSRGTVDATAQVTTGYTPPTHVVLSGLTDISGDVATLRANGSQIAQATTDQGTGNFLAYPAYLYARGGTTQPAAVRDYGHAVRFGPNLDAATIAQVEALIARNTPTVTL